MQIRKLLCERALNIVSTVASIAALVVALQANQIARQSNKIAIEASEPKLEVIIEPILDVPAIVQDACVGEAPSSAYTTLQNLDARFTIMNKGGGDVSLMGISFSENNKPFSTYLIYEYQSDFANPGESLTLPLEIDAGRGKKWRIRTVNAEVGGSLSDALVRLRYDRIKNNLDKNVNQMRFES